MASRNLRPYDEPDASVVTAGAGVPGDITDPTAVAGQVAWLIRSRIFAGEYAPGAELPSQLDLAKRFGYSEATINRAMAELARQGLIRQGSGRRTTVQPHYAFSVTVLVAAASPSADPEAAMRALAGQAGAEPALLGEPGGLLALPAGLVVMDVRAANPAQAAVTGWAVLAAALGADWDVAGARIEVGRAR